MSGMGTGTKIGFILISILVVIVIANLLNNEVQNGPSGEEQVTGRSINSGQDSSNVKPVRKIPTRNNDNSDTAQTRQPKVAAPITASGTSTVRPPRPVRNSAAGAAPRTVTSGNSGTTGQLSSGTARLNEAEVVKTTGVIRNEGTQQGSQRGSSAVTASGSQRTVNKPAKAPLPQRQFKKITVRSGDSLWRIAERHLGSGNAYNKIISANSGLTESTVLKEGQVLRVPVAGGTSQPQRTSRPAVARGAKAYQIQEGDTLWDIASDRLGDGNRWQEIREANPGVNLDVLKVGVVINLP